MYFIYCRQKSTAFPVPSSIKSKSFVVVLWTAPVQNFIQIGHKLWKVERSVYDRVYETHCDATQLYAHFPRMILTFRNLPSYI